jgi:hypothetical protein
MNSDEVEQLRELLKIHKKRVNVLEQQAAKYGINCPPEIKIEIEDIQEQIKHFERNLQGNVIQSYLQGRETLRQFNRELDSVTHGLSNVVVEEKRTYRFFGLPVWSVVISRTILTLLMVVAGFGAGLTLQQRNQTGLSPQATAQAALATAQAAPAISQAALATAQTAQAEAQAARATAQAETQAARAALATAQARVIELEAEVQALQATITAQQPLPGALPPTPTATP